MRRSIRATVVFGLLACISAAYLYLQFVRYPFAGDSVAGNFRVRYAVGQGKEQSLIRESYSAPGRGDSPVDAVLVSDWEVLLVLPPAATLSGDRCLFQNGAFSPVRPFGVLFPSNRTTARCKLPRSVRRLSPFRQPILVTESVAVPFPADRPELLRWSFLVYEALPTASDVVVFAKGLNSRQGVNFPTDELRCVFGDESGPGGIAYTRVVSSYQEVFRCLPPPPGVYGKVSLDVGGRIMPSVAYYRPPLQEASPSTASGGYEHELCASTMVFNVGKFLKEWVMYHSFLGVDRFVLYDNGSEDDTERIVAEDLADYNVTRILWPWPKTQEAGFSHSAASVWGSSCKWTMFIDVDEFFFSPTWANLTSPRNALRELVSATGSDEEVGQIQARCIEFGPSGQKKHPPAGVMQGYDCRRRAEQRHKSIVRAGALAESLLNVVHHFELRDGFETSVLEREVGSVHHYKYQAWSEFRAKFRRRVSAYVVDWRQSKNLSSKDRTPGLGSEPVEPPGWPAKFCEVRDLRLKEFSQRWFGTETESGLKTVWEDK
ncbi:glycosyltransferase family 92 protein RCOM_0530710 [Nymphaea colorata]|nr:glycosyltransferase family 92 protein RCOM_0530710 [Nymphaea colorata]